MSEVLAVDTTAEADAADAELASFRTDSAAKHADLASLRAFKEEIEGLQVAWLNSPHVPD